MSITDYQQLLDDVITPTMTETVFRKNFQEMVDMFTADPRNEGGSQIIKPLRTSIENTARNYTRDDVDPTGGSFVSVQAKWDKTYQEVAFEIHNIDLAEAGNGGIVELTSLLEDNARLAMGDLGQLSWENLYTRITADVDSNNTYSDAALSRTTYPTLASYEETTDAAITLDYLRTASNTVRLNKNTGGKGGYLWMMEQQVYDVFEPLAAALHTWNVYGEKGQAIAGGYQPIGSFEGTDVATPQGMTTGDVFFVRPQDVMIRNHRGLTIKQVESGRDSAKFIARQGVTGYVENPGFQGKLTNKD
jgi:hypothetical protein